MQKQKTITRTFISFAVAGLLLGMSLIFIAQQINRKVYDYSPRQTHQARRFQETFARQTSLLLVLALIQMGGSVLLALLALKASSAYTQSSKDFAEMLSLLEGPKSNQNLSPEEALKSLRESVNKMALDLVEARKRERAVIERAVDVICIIDINSKFVSVSRACLHAWGYTPAELEQRPLTDLLVGVETDNLLGSILGAANSIDKIVFECKLRKKNGELSDVVWTGHWSASDSGLFCIVHDITERKRAEELVKRSEERLRLTLEALPAGVLILNKANKIEFANSEASHLMLYTPSELSGKPLESFFKDRNPLEGKDQGSNSSTIPEKSILRFLGTAVRKDNSIFPIEISECKIELSGEIKTISVFLDKTAEQELEQMKREFTAMVTHDLKTPLTSVHGILSLLEEGILGSLTDHGRDMISRVRHSCKRLLRLINDLLDLEKISAGMFSLECKEININNIFEQSLETVKSLAEERNIKFENTSTDLKCWADEERLIQVLINLLSNALKYSPNDSTIELAATDMTEFVRISVTDHGRGIPNEMLNRVFEKFQQVEISDAKKKGGTGLGLAICKAIIAEHRGEIGVSSQYGQGCTFWFTIPKFGKN